MRQEELPPAQNPRAAQKQSLCPLLIPTLSLFPHRHEQGKHRPGPSSVLLPKERSRRHPWAHQHRQQPSPALFQLLLHKKCSFLLNI